MEIENSEEVTNQPNKGVGATSLLNFHQEITDYILPHELGSCHAASEMVTLITLNSNVAILVAKIPFSLICLEARTSRMILGQSKARSTSSSPVIFGIAIFGENSPTHYEV